MYIQSYFILSVFVPKTCCFIHQFSHISFFLVSKAHYSGQIMM